MAEAPGDRNHMTRPDKETMSALRLQQCQPSPLTTPPPSPLCPEEHTQRPRWSPMPTSHLISPTQCGYSLSHFPIHKELKARAVC